VLYQYLKNISFNIYIYKETPRGKEKEEEPDIEWFSKRDASLLTSAL
jgi:hypothetical protein